VRQALGGGAGRVGGQVHARFKGILSEKVYSKNRLKRCKKAASVSIKTTREKDACFSSVQSSVQTKKMRYAIALDGVDIIPGRF